MITQEEKNKDTYEFTPEPDMFASEVLCNRCKHKDKCISEEGLINSCAAYRLIDSLL